MAQIMVTPDEIREVARQVESGAAEIEQQRQTLLSHIQRLGGSWQGPAASALQGLYEKWDTQARALHQTLDEIGKAMTTAAQNYEVAEQDLAKSFQV